MKVTSAPQKPPTTVATIMLNGPAAFQPDESISLQQRIRAQKRSRKLIKREQRGDIGTFHIHSPFLAGKDTWRQVGHKTTVSGKLTNKIFFLSMEGICCDGV